jgi:hypothetical protein
MEAARGRTRARLIVVDFLATLFVTFCIGAATALVLGACVLLMSGDAHGASQPRPAAAPATTADLVLAHYMAARHAGLALVERAAAAPQGPKAKPGKPQPQAPVTN